MYVLDTDHISLIHRAGTDGQCIRARLARVPPHDVALTIVSYEEQMRGWMAAIAQAHTPRRQVPLYRELERLLQLYALTPLLPFDDRAAAVLERLQRLRIRMGTMDLKIACVALANGATLLSRNASDFGKVPGLHVEDWSAGSPGDLP